MTHVIEPAPAGQFSAALEEVRRSAKQLLADVDSQPRLLRIRAGEVVVELEWTGQAPGPAAPVVDVPEQCAGDVPVEIHAPTVGTFYRAPQPGAAPFVSEGDEVRRGQQIGIVEAMKLMIPVESEHDGVVAAILVADAASVEYGQPLIALSPVAGHRVAGE